MKLLIRHIKLIFLCLSLPLIALAQMNEVFTFINATAQDQQIILQWRVSNKAETYSFEILRKSDEVSNFRRIGRVQSSGVADYTYTDNGAFFKFNTSKIFTYRIKAIGAQSSFYSNLIIVSNETSSVQRSWGMIKELFR